MKRLFTYAAFSLSTVLLSCGGKSRQAEPAFYDDLLTLADTATVPLKEEAPKEEKTPPTPVCSSSSSLSRPHISNSCDNMRGFDPESEDDMEDNGMSRCMENNDEEGWD